MVMRETKSGSVFSWADEVEKEEQEEAEARCRGGKKPNPFDPASPAVVVLQHKGINGRKLGLHLHQPSPLRHESQNKKLQKPNPPARPRFEGSPVCSSVVFASHIQSSILSLRYPPKYVAGVPYQHWVSTSLNALDSNYRDFKPTKENRFYEGRKSHNLRSTSAMSGYRRAHTELVQAKDKILRESVLHGNKPEADAATQTKRFRSRQVNQNINGDLGMDGTSFPVTENKAMEDICQKFTRKVQDLYVKQEDKSWRDAPFHKIKGETAICRSS